MAHTQPQCACGGKADILPALRENYSTNSQILPVVRPQGPTARDPSSCTVQYTHICFKPATFQFACHLCNLTKTTTLNGVTPTEVVNVCKSQLCFCFYSIHLSICIRKQSKQISPCYCPCGLLPLCPCLCDRH